VSGLCVRALVCAVSSVVLLEFDTFLGLKERFALKMDSDVRDAVTSSNNHEHRDTSYYKLRNDAV
jgi:hypothetical protein